MAQFSKEELSFVKELPEHVEIECPVCLNILTDPHLVSCCGHNFCGSCIERVKASNGSCPMCKEKEYQTMADKKCSRIINGLEVYCSNRKEGCQWKGELKNMPIHLNKEKREGECQYEEVKCRYQKCRQKKQRRYLKYHEDKECPHRPFQCQYCRRKGTFLSITKDHYEECRQYPVTCLNKCVSTKMPRGSLTAHVNRECPLEPVNCVFSWAGCNDKPL
ncbi:PREDICTED: TNF receptor-associated factor 3-like, partial [Amphimedon queenslandica]|uniref:RING-type domain-containing protein n=2 Tax=Amphimedon queenslandica TaxID=400682 RepID=A0AAN0IST7_AMPQE